MEWCPFCGVEQEDGTNPCSICETILSTYNPTKEGDKYETNSNATGQDQERPYKGSME